MVCSSGVGFDPNIDGTVYTFDVAGIYNGLFVMSDRQTGSVWTHYDGTVLEGPLAGQDISLTIEPMVHTTWEQWADTQPETLVLDWYEQFASRYRDVSVGQAGLGTQFRDTLVNVDDRLAENELVVGAGVGSDFRAYVLADAGDGLTVINDVLGDQPVVVFVDSSASFGLAFWAVVGDQIRTFSVAGDKIVDDTGTTWAVDGTAIDGPEAGESLDFVTSFVTEWYGWAAYHPATGIYGD